MSLRATFCYWIIALLALACVLIALAIVSQERHRKENNLTEEEAWKMMTLDFGMEFFSEVIGFMIDILVLIGIAVEEKCIVIVWLLAVPFRVVIHLGGAIFTICTDTVLASQTELSTISVSFRILFAVMLMYSLYVGAHYFMQLRRRAYLDVPTSGEPNWNHRIMEQAVQFFRRQRHSSEAQDKPSVSRARTVDAEEAGE